MMKISSVYKKYYENTEREIIAVDNVSISVEKGEFLVVLGKSGSGKSTLLNILGGLDTPTSGEVVFKGGSLYNKNYKKHLANYLKSEVGFVFQSFNLISSLSALKNVQIAMDIKDINGKKGAKKAKDILKFLGLEKRIQNKAVELSGGEQQRVAIARALVKEPKIILADEPTGNLDSETGKEIVEIFRKINKEKRVTVIVVTHDEDIARVASRVIRMKDGKIVSDSNKT